MHILPLALLFVPVVKFYACFAVTVSNYKQKVSCTLCKLKYTIQAISCWLSVSQYLQTAFTQPWKLAQNNLDNHFSISVESCDEEHFYFHITCRINWGNKPDTLRGIFIYSFPSYLHTNRRESKNTESFDFLDALLTHTCISKSEFFFRLCVVHIIRIINVSFSEHNENEENVFTMDRRKRWNSWIFQRMQIYKAG